MRRPLLLLLSVALLGQAPSPRPALRPGDWRGLASALQGATRQGQFSGVIMAAQGDRILYEGAFGLARRGDGVPNALDTRFNLASMGKLFTAVAIGQLMEEGKVHLDDPILKFLPEYRNQPGWDRVKVRHLLTHTAGFGDIWGPQFEASRAHLRAVKDYFPLFLGKPLAFKPGSRWQYSNVGFILLGAIIERASGEDYFTYIQRHVFDPAGMKDAGFFEMDQDTPRLAVGYFHPRDAQGRLLSPAWRNDSLVRLVKGCPAGGCYATAPDLLRFARALMGGRLVKPETFRQLITPQVTVPGPPGAPMTLSYGFGFGIETRGTQILVGHNGGGPGITTDMVMDLATGRVVVMLSNLDPQDLGPVVPWIRQVLAP